MKAPRPMVPPELELQAIAVDEIDRAILRTAIQALWAIRWLDGGILTPSECRRVLALFELLR